MINPLQVLASYRRLNRLIFAAGLGAFLLLVGLQSVVFAAFRAGGAGNCGAFGESVILATDGDIVTQMIPARNSEGATISESLRLSGGWFPNQNCEENNQTFTETADFFDYGFQYMAPITRSGLFYFSGSILNVDLDGKKAIVEHFELDGQDPIDPDVIQGFGFSGVLTNGAELLLDNVVVKDTLVRDFGGGIYLIVDGSQLIIEDSEFTGNRAGDRGGGLYVELRNGSKMVIDNSSFTDNDSPFGGAFEIHVDESSELLIKNSHFASNRTTLTSGSGGAGHLIIQGGAVNIMDTVFDNNRAGKIGGGLYVEMQGGSLTIKSTLFSNNQSTTSPGTAGSGLYVENSGTEDATLNLVNTTFTNNTGAPQFQTSQTGTGVLDTTNYDEQVFVPLNVNHATPSLDYARILSVELDSNYNYLIHFDTNFAPNTAATHIHFFFDTVAQDQAGIPASPSNWKLYGGPSPFTGYSFRDRPFTATGAEQICVLVANAGHSIRLNTGNCVKLP